MKVLSLFSGVGGFDMGLENAGMQTVFQCEWDKHCRTVLDRHWPTVPKWDDVSTLTGEHILAHAPVIDVVAWGSPCQDLSVAGKRAGLEGGRSGLFYEGIRIINELRKASNGRYPRISIWENVYGALNSNKGEDFEAILKEMVEAGSLLCEWRVLDAQYFGVPQRRRRVFVVAVFDTATANRCPDPLLPVSEGLRWHPSTGAATREESADTVTASIGSGGAVTNTISASLYHHGTVVNQDANNGHVVIEPSVVVGTLTVSDLTKQVNNEIINKGLLQVVEAYTSSSFAQYEQGVGTLRSNGGDLGGGSETLLLDGTRVDDVRVYESPVQTLKERMGTGGNNVPMVAFSYTQGLDAQPTGVVVGTLRSGGDGGVPSSRGEHLVVVPTMVVRRLTPLECERLMGWPDDHTRYKADGTEQADTHRYKQCGNGVASPVAEWIGEQLMNLEEQQ